MYLTDRDAFTQVLTQLGEVFGKAITPSLTTVYWEALKDLPIGTVQRIATLHTKHGRYFPKPLELRPKGEKVPVVTADPAYERAVRFSAANLERLKILEPERWKAEVRARQNARVLATAHPSSLEYAEAYQIDADLRKSAGWLGANRLDEMIR